MFRWLPVRSFENVCDGQGFRYKLLLKSPQMGSHYVLRLNKGPRTKSSVHGHARTTYQGHDDNRSTFQTRVRRFRSSSCWLVVRVHKRHFYPMFLGLPIMFGGRRNRERVILCTFLRPLNIESDVSVAPGTQLCIRL